MSTSRYSIKDLENFTQIKSHTIRIWEQRYNMLRPERTETNIRYYSEDDLKKILNINLLYNNGYKISKIATFSDAELIDTAKKIIINGESDYQADLDALIVAILNFNQIAIRSLLEKRCVELKMEGLCDKIIIPVLQKIGDLWQVNSFEIIHEHFFSNLLRDFIVHKTQELNFSPDKIKKAVLFLHEDEQHELSLLMSNYILKVNGYQCHYFGQNVPVTEVHFAIAQIKPQLAITTFIANISDKKFKMIMDNLLIMSQKCTVVISGSQLKVKQREIPNGVHIIQTIRQLTELVKD